jgi:hypothetical protein
MGYRRGHGAHSAHVCRARKLSLGGLQCVLCLHFFRNIKRHAESVLASRRPIRNPKNIKLYPDQLAVFTLQLFNLLEMITLPLL